MFQRLKGAIDSRIAEEQARQKLASESPSRSNSTVRSAARTDSPSKRQARAKLLAEADADAAGKGPDPSEFEQEPAGEDDAAPSRVDTPSPEKGKGSTVGDGPSETQPVEGEGDRPPTESPAAQSPAKLPTDVRVKLRKLDKLEGRYQELLRSYRIAHARVLSIEPFETALRENTPLTSITDPGALVEYLNQITLKSDMVMDELKRVTSDHDSTKQKLREAEKKAKDAWDEVKTLRDTGGALVDGADSAPAPKDGKEDEKAEIAETKSVRPASESDKVTTQSQSEDLFSYEDELPRLESELQERTAEVEELSTEVKTLKNDLSVARESTEGMVQSLEVATREASALREAKGRHETECRSQKAALEEDAARAKEQLEAAREELQEVRSNADQQQGSPDKENTKAENEELAQDAMRLRKTIADHELRVKSLEQSVADTQKRLEEAEAAKARLGVELATRTKNMEALELKVREQESRPKAASAAPAAPTATTDRSLSASVDAAATSATGTTSSKNKKKKKKGGKAAATVDSTASATNASKDVPATPSAAVAPTSTRDISKLEDEVRTLRSSLEEKQRYIETLELQRKTEDDLREEVESLRDDLVHVGQDHVLAKEKIKQIEAERSALSEKLRSVEEEIGQYHSQNPSVSGTSAMPYQQLSQAFDELKSKAHTLETDLSAAQQLAASRYKDLAEMREVLQKAQPELTSLRSEVAALKTAREELSAKTAEVRKVESREQDLRAEVTDLKTQTAQRASETKSLADKLSLESSKRLRAQEAQSTAENDLRLVETEKKKAIEAQTTMGRELVKVRGEATTLRARVREAEQHAARLGSEMAGLREEIELKSAQYASAESVMGSMRDQTAELAVQMKEALARSESVEEELGDAQRLLSERSREGETMRRLLADVDGRAEARVREMRAQLEVAVEERDRAEEEASTIGRRRAREVEDLKSRVRELERSVKRADEGRRELEAAELAWTRRRDDLETRAAQAAQEVGDVRAAMGELRDALDASEAQLREVERHKAELRRAVEDGQTRLDKAHKAHRVLGEQLRALKAARAKPLESDGPSSRSSVDSAPSKPRMASPAATKTRASPLAPNGADAAASMDYVYLKNVLLQFLEQRDKKHQMQLIPVLGMLLHFDAKDEQKWMAAIATK